jgi:hypothetical protein
VGGPNDGGAQMFSRRQFALLAGVSLSGLASNSSAAVSSEITEDDIYRRYPRCRFEPPESAHFRGEHRFSIPSSEATESANTVTIRTVERDGAISWYASESRRLGDEFLIGRAEEHANTLLTSGVKKSTAARNAVANELFERTGVWLSSGLYSVNPALGKIDLTSGALTQIPLLRFFYPTMKHEARGCWGAINTYDWAGFSFGIFQFGAHTPRNNLVEYLRRLLGQPGEASRYLPDLRLKEASLISTSADGAEIDLELVGAYQAHPRCWDGRGLPALATFLNPDPYAVGVRELEMAARLMIWTRDSDHAKGAQCFAQLEKVRTTFRPRIQPFRTCSSDWRSLIAAYDCFHQGVDLLSKLAETDANTRLASILEGSRSAKVRAGRTDALAASLDELAPYMADWDGWGPAIMFDPV